MKTVDELAKELQIYMKQHSYLDLAHYVRNLIIEARIEELKLNLKEMRDMEQYLARIAELEAMKEET